MIRSRPSKTEKVLRQDVSEVLVQRFRPAVIVRDIKPVLRDPCYYFSPIKVCRQSY